MTKQEILDETVELLDFILGGYGYCETVSLAEAFEAAHKKIQQLHDELEDAQEQWNAAEIRLEDARAALS